VLRNFGLLLLGVLQAVLLPHLHAYRWLSLPETPVLLRAVHGLVQPVLRSRVQLLADLLPLRPVCHVLRVLVPRLRALHDERV